jgi:hypothetical protein
MNLADTEKAEIEVDVSEDGATAHFRGKQIGEVTIFLDDEAGTAAINQMFVHDEYQQNGIGLRLIEALFNTYGVLGRPPMEGPNVTTFDGAKLVNKAIAKGWVSTWSSDDPASSEE